MNSLLLIGYSLRHYFRLIRKGRLHLRTSRLGEKYHITSYGTYTIFRETESEEKVATKPTVLVVGFRLRLIGSFPLLHFLFQRLCIVTTPFWSGFFGFHIKLWMVDQKTKDYLGIYEWYGKENAQAYVHTLTKILSPLSTAHSVWYRIYKEVKLDTFLEKRIVSPTYDEYRFKLRFDELAFTNHHEAAIGSILFLAGMLFQAFLQQLTSITVSSIIGVSLFIILTLKLLNDRKNIKHNKQWYE